MVTTTDAKNKEFVWVKRGNMWVKKYPTSWKGYKEPVIKPKTWGGKIQQITFKNGGYVYKDKHGKEV